MPDFCTGPAVFASMVLAQLVALLLALVPLDDWDAAWNRLLFVSVFVQWIAITSVTLLCLLKKALSRLPLTLLVVIQYTVVLLVVLALSELTYQTDQAMSLGLTVSPDLHWRFIVGNVLIAACVAAAGVRYFYLSAQRERIRLARSEARVQALQSRIRPHFLFNSMNTIAGLIGQDPATAERAVEDLSDLFRGALAADREEVPLGAEIELAQRYLAIEKLRLGDRLDEQWSLGDVPMDLRLPPLTLQPLLENAIYHGIQRMPDGGRVSVSGHTRGDRVHLRIRNPLPGDTTPGNGQGAGIALDNIAERLHHWSSGRARLEVSESRHHFEVEIVLPRYADEAVDR